MVVMLFLLILTSENAISDTSPTLRSRGNVSCAETQVLKRIGDKAEKIGELGG